MTTLPAIGGYQLPSSNAFESAGPSWILQPSRAVLLVHDMQNYFVRVFGESLRVALVNNVAQVVDWARRNDVPIAWSQQPGGMAPQERGLLADIWGPGMSLSEDDRAIVPPLTKTESDWALTKWRYSAFVRSDFAQRMHEGGRDQLVLCGVFGHVGVISTAVDAYQRDTEVFIVSDAVGDFELQRHMEALRWAAATCARLTDTEAFANEG